MSMGRTSRDTTTSSEWDSMFERKEGEWRCERCFGENPEEADDYCLSCNYPKRDGLKTPRDAIADVTTVSEEEKEGEGTVVGVTASATNTWEEAFREDTTAEAEGARTKTTSDTTPLRKARKEVTKLFPPPKPEEETRRALPESGWGDFFKL